MTTVAMPSLKELRVTCDKLDIKWHPRHSERSLRLKIDGYYEVISDNDESIPKPDPEAIKHPKKPKPKSRPKREIPQNVKDHLKYMHAYKKAGAEVIEQYIESLL